MWHSWIPAAESGIVFQGDLCLTGKRKYYGEKEEAFCFHSFPHQQEKGRGLRYTRKKRVGPVHVKIREGRGKPAGDKSMRAQALKERNGI